MFQRQREMNTISWNLQVCGLWNFARNWKENRISREKRRFFFQRERKENFFQQVWKKESSCPLRDINRWLQLPLFQIWKGLFCNQTVQNSSFQGLKCCTSLPISSAPSIFFFSLFFYLFLKTFFAFALMQARTRLTLPSCIFPGQKK